MLSFHRTFAASPEALSSGHPYSLDNSKKSCTIPFVEFRGIGPPSSSIGHPGDVYVDLTHTAHALYWRDRNENDPGPWRRWTSVLLDQVPLYKFLVCHPWADNPQTSDLYLWADPTGISWTSRAEICASRVMMVQKNIAATAPSQRSPDVAALVSEILVKMIDMEDRRTLPPILESSHDQGPYTTAPFASRPRSLSSSADYQSTLPHRAPRPSSPHHYPSKRRNTITNPPTQLPPLAVVVSPRLASRAKSPPLSFRPMPYEKPRPASPPPTSFSDHRPQHAISEPDQRCETPLINSRRHEPTSSPSQPPANGHATIEGVREDFAWTEMQRAQYAEAHFKRELRQKNRELSKFKKKEKDIISLSFIYQKKEQELLDALATTERRSNDELEKQREAVRDAQRHVEEAERQTQDAVRELRQLEDVLNEARKEIQRLRSYAEKMEAENGELKDEMSKSLRSSGEP
ncbi:hypothetical protein MIND_00783600 [Mycena indigotica]|uniref:Uncharacterized protein n=1 Tax=Mycena indigotica TaxID=2126181 RepID=A0A8H6SNR5_9AGAR|nr:uncharacterized protein MIND_00783600 [Mycena indigotica]KAF7302167.1 hypothetical protein MIND_00783600 [Mycena indigotica]